EYLHVIDEKLAGAVGLLEQAIASGTVSLGAAKPSD
ncbi:MAG: 5'-methylthioadenosine/S-adenosylhomocysteine nucleosidase, partial [Mesorhizobium sp.]